MDLIVKTTKIKLSEFDRTLLTEALGTLIWLKDGGDTIADVPRSVFVDRTVTPLLDKILDRLEGKNER